jgi:hypothetical protein
MKVIVPEIACYLCPETGLEYWQRKNFGQLHFKSNTFNTICNVIGYVRICDRLD